MAWITKNKKQINPLPFGVYFWTVTTIALIGLANAVYLAISHYRVYTDIGYESFCAISQAINCDTVSQSSYSIFIGIPVPVWGVLGYTGFLVLLILAHTRRAAGVRLWCLLMGIALVFCLYSVVLAAISTYLIHSYCIMCIVSYAVNFGLLYFCWLISRRFKIGPMRRALADDVRFLAAVPIKQTAMIFAPYVLLCLLVIIFFPVYWSFDPPVLNTRMQTGFTADGHPWVGAQDPEIVITEFADYQCFQCNKMHYFLRRLLIRYPNKVRIIHRHFPMDHTINPLVHKPLHRGSAVLAVFAIYAGTQNKFWQMSDLLFSHARQMDRIDIPFLARQAGLEPARLAGSIRDPKLINALKKDIRDGLALGVNGTPSFVINGQLYQGYIPAEVFNPTT